MSTPKCPNLKCGRDLEYAGAILVGLGEGTKVNPTLEGYTCKNEKCPYHNKSLFHDVKSGKLFEIRERK